jgi:hypothetical protein
VKISDIHQPLPLSQPQTKPSAHSLNSQPQQGTPKLIAFAQILLANLDLGAQPTQALQQSLAQSAMGALLAQLLGPFNMESKPASSQSIKTLLQQLLSFQPLGSNPSPLNASFNLAMIATLLGRLSPEAARLLTTHLSQKQLQQLKGLDANAQDNDGMTRLLSKMSSQFQSSQLACANQNGPNDPTFFSFPLQQGGELRRLEARLSQGQQQNSDSAERSWQLRMLLPIGQDQHILAQVNLTTTLETKLSFYCPNQQSLDQLNENLSTFEERLTQLGLNQLTLQSQLGRIPATLQQTDSTRLDISV